MPKIYGTLLFDPNRTRTISYYNGIKNVSMVLQNLENNLTIAVTTDPNGRYIIDFIEEGDYQIVEYYDYPDSGYHQVDYRNAVVKPLLETGKTPPISYIQNPPEGANFVDSTTNNTIKLKIELDDLDNIIILNGPVKYTNLVIDKNVSLSNINLIKNAENGTFGFIPNGSSIETFKDSSYVGVGEGFNFVTTNPNKGEYSIQNISEVNEYKHSVTDYTNGNELGLMMVVNSDLQKRSLFNEFITLKKDTYYLFKTFIVNTNKLENNIPKIGIKLTSSDDVILLDEDLKKIISVNKDYPEWIEIGSIIYTKNYDNLKVELISSGSDSLFSLDNICLEEVTLPNPISLNQTVDKESYAIGETINFTLSFENYLDFKIENIFIQDEIPESLEFVEGSVKVNGVEYKSFSIVDGFSLDDLDDEYIITFECIVRSFQTNPITNAANLSYSYSFVEGGIPTSFNVNSNTVEILVEDTADIGVNKILVNDYVYLNDFIYYNLEVKNYGPNTARNVVLFDEIPLNLKAITYSIDNGLNFLPWPKSNIIEIGDLRLNELRTIIVKGKVTEGSVIINKAIVSTTSIDPNLLNNVSINSKNIVNSADLNIIKVSCPVEFKNCSNVLYQIVVTNNGPGIAYDVVVEDTIPKVIQSLYYSIDNINNFKKYNGSINLENIFPNESKVIYIKGLLHYTSCKEIVNSVSVTSKTFDPNLLNNNYTLVTKIKSC